MKEINMAERLVMSFLLQGLYREALISQRVADAVNRRIISESKEGVDGNEESESAA